MCKIKELTKKIRRNWDGLEGSKKITFILQSMEAIKKYENEVQELKRLCPGAATDEIPDTINVLTKSDLAVYDTHEGRELRKCSGVLVLSRNNSNVT